MYGIHPIQFQITDPASSFKVPCWLYHYWGSGLFCILVAFLCLFIYVQYRFHHISFHCSLQAVVAPKEKHF